MPSQCFWSLATGQSSLLTDSEQMDSAPRLLCTPSDKKKLRLELSGEEGLTAFQARLTGEELEALSRLKESRTEICARWNDAFLMRFLWARKLDVERAIELLENHLSWREEYDIDGELDVERMGLYLRHPFAPWTPGNYTKQGHSVSYMRARYIDKDMLESLGVAGVMQGNYAAMDAASDHDMDIGRNGLVIVEDFEGASFSDLMAVVRGESAWDMRKMSAALQNNLPFRVGGFILVNAPWYIKLLTSIVKPMLKPKLSLSMQ